MEENKRNKRKVYVTVAIFLIILFMAQIHPIYYLVNRVEPIVFGMPFAMFWLVLMCVLQFCTLFGLYIWEYPKGR